MIKRLEVNTEECFHELGERKDLLKRTQKALRRKGKIDKLEIVKIKNFSSSKDQ